MVSEYLVGEANTGDVAFYSLICMILVACSRSTWLVKIGDSGDSEDGAF